MARPQLGGWDDLPAAQARPGANLGHFLKTVLAAACR